MKESTKSLLKLIKESSYDNIVYNGEIEDERMFLCTGKKVVTNKYKDNDTCLFIFNGYFDHNDNVNGFEFKSGDGVIVITNNLFSLFNPYTYRDTMLNKTFLHSIVTRRKVDMNGKKIFIHDVDYIVSLFKKADIKSIRFDGGYVESFSDYNSVLKRYKQVGYALQKKIIVEMVIT